MLKNTPICDFGQKALPFELADLNGKICTFENEMGENGLLLAFICNHCPYVQTIIDRLVADANALKREGISTLAIMSNDYRMYPDDSPEKMREFANLHGMNFPYLIDETQEVAKAYGAICTPDFFGYNKNGELQYRGRIDDAKMGDASDRTPELLNAMRQIILTGKGPEQQIPSMGCSIKWKN